MQREENNGGFLRNDQVEKDLKAKGVSNEPRPYRGTQDTGQFMPPQKGKEGDGRNEFSPEDEHDTGRA